MRVVPGRPRRLGLRMRMTLAFALGALVLSVTLATLTYELARGYLLGQRDAAILRQADVNARLVRDTLAGYEPNQEWPIARLLAGLQLPDQSYALLARVGPDAQQAPLWFSSKPEGLGGGAGTLQPAQRLPVALRRTVTLRHSPARQRFTARGGEHKLAVGLPIRRIDAYYFEVVSLQELSRTLSVLRDSLVLAALFTAIGGAAVGRWGSRRVLTPVRAVAAAATAVADGRLDSRLDVGGDPDLATVANAFNSMTNALEERVQRDARFSSAVSHELRSPLTTLATSTEVLLARRDDLPERARRALDLMASEVRRFERLVQELLEISRIDAGAATVPQEEVRLGEFVLQALRSGGHRGFHVDLDPRASRMVIRADKRRLERVVANLVENADRYGGGVVRVALEHTDRSLRLAVEDAGPGVAADERDRIFERFVRGAAAQRRGDSDGTGLGLSLVAEHVKLHGGRVWVEDRTGGGARFVVELPVARRR